MRKKVLLYLVICILISHSLFAQRNLFSETIPLRGHIDLEEKFSLAIKQKVFFIINQDLAGTTHEIATYEFLSNSPNVAYQMRLSPSFTTQLGEGVFAFRNTRGSSFSSGFAPIPFRLSVSSQSTESTITNEEFREIQKSIGIKVGSRSQESGTIFVTFPTPSEGFNMQAFSSGAYEASIAVEVLAD
ncbi:MAG: hypothetical protein WCS59_00625 [Sphaerochaetaceae bacterium]|nr:hypothetical protein [Sphaerochaetaceae bacterium]